MPAVKRVNDSFLKPIPQAHHKVMTHLPNFMTLKIEGYILYSWVNNNRNNKHDVIVAHSNVLES